MNDIKIYRDDEDYKGISFSFTEEHTIENAINWIGRLVNKNIIETQSILLEDTIRRFDGHDGDNLSKSFQVPILTKEIVDYFNKNDVHQISINGTYKDLPLMILFPIRNSKIDNYRINISINKENIPKEFLDEKFLYKNIICI